MDKTSRGQQRELKNATRELDREQSNLTRDEQKLQDEIKLCAKRGDEASARILAKQLVQIRNLKARNLATKSTVQSTGYSLKSAASQATMGKAMQSATRAMAVTNQQMDIGQIQAMSQRFEMESAKMEMSSEMMDGTFDSVFEGNEEMESGVMDQIYDEIGLDIRSSASKVPLNKVAQDIDLSDDVIQRLAKLKE